MLRSVFCLFVLVCLTVASCGKDGDISTPGRCDATLFNEAVNPKLASWQTAATNFVNDPSEANCEAYKQTGQAFLASIRGYRDCAGLYTQAWKDAVSEAEMELAAQPCD